MSGLNAASSFLKVKTLLELFQEWKHPIGVPRGMELWRLSFLAVLWTIWKERNSMCFEGVASSVNCLVEKTKFFSCSMGIYKPIF